MFKRVKRAFAGVGDFAKALYVQYKRVLFAIIGAGVIITATVTMADRLGITAEAPGETQAVKFQDVYSMDWDAEQEQLLLKVAAAKGGTVEDRAYNILVLLNRTFSDIYPDSIEQNAADVLKGQAVQYGIDDLKALQMIVAEHWDETNGATEYRRANND